MNKNNSNQIINTMRIIAIFLFSVQVYSQNLVENPSFENTGWCSSYIGDFNISVTNWSTPTGGTTDLFNSCAKGNVSVPDNSNGKQHPKSGKNYAGFYLHAEKDYREYIQTELTKKLKKDKEYTISFYVSLAETSDFAIKDIDFLLSKNEINTWISRALSVKQLKKIKVNNYTHYSFNNTQFYDNESGWTLIKMSFKAAGDEKFLTIGNFQKNSKTEKLPVSNKNRFNASYYYIDSVSLIETETSTIIKNDEMIETSKELITQKNVLEIELNKDYIFENVVFEINSTELSSDAKKELMSIYQYLKQNRNTEIEISGHTDNNGTSILNKKLSQKRALSVSDFLTLSGLSQNRIKTFGYGNTKPITTNDTEEGNAKNRRVEFKILVKTTNKK